MIRLPDADFVLTGALQITGNRKQISLNTHWEAGRLGIVGAASISNLLAELPCLFASQLRKHMKNKVDQTAKIRVMIVAIFATERTLLDSLLSENADCLTADLVS